jgi:hypothetical protein
VEWRGDASILARPRSVNRWEHHGKLKARRRPLEVLLSSLSDLVIWCLETCDEDSKPPVAHVVLATK